MWRENFSILIFAKYGLLEIQWGRSQLQAKRCGLQCWLLLNQLCGLGKLHHLTRLSNLIYKKEKLRSPDCRTSHTPSSLNIQWNKGLSIFIYFWCFLLLKWMITFESIHLKQNMDLRHLRKSSSWPLAGRKQTATSSWSQYKIK